MGSQSTIPACPEKHLGMGSRFGCEDDIKLAGKMVNPGLVPDHITNADKRLDDQQPITPVCSSILNLSAITPTLPCTAPAILVLQRCRASD